MNWLSKLPAASTLECADGAIPPRLFDSAEPVLLKGLVNDWPAVRECSPSIHSAVRYLAQFWTDQPVTAFAGNPEMDGRFFYNEDCTGFNFQKGAATLAQILQKLAEPEREAHLSSIYVGSTPVDNWLPGFRAGNDVQVPSDEAVVSFWLGGPAHIAAHYDYPSNLACVVAGERRFTLLPPEQLGNLYVGPLDRTPAGQPISLVDFAQPDLARHPQFAEAMRHAKTASLRPGDALFIPSMWWHHVESSASFNLLINYWWLSSPAYLGSPTDALVHGILALRGLPPRQREAWRGLFNHYVFDADEAVYQHIPQPGRGCLAPLDEAAAKQLRAKLLHKLNS